MAELRSSVQEIKAQVARQSRQSLFRAEDLVHQRRRIQDQVNRGRLTFEENKEECYKRFEDEVRSGGSASFSSLSPSSLSHRILLLSPHHHMYISLCTRRRRHLHSTDQANDADEVNGTEEPVAEERSGGNPSSPHRKLEVERLREVISCISMSPTATRSRGVTVLAKATLEVMSMASTIS